MGSPLPYQIHGDGPPLLLLPGLGGKGASWRPFLDTARERFATITLELPGSARGPRLCEPASVRDLAARTAELIEHLRLPALHVAGRSMGGMIAQELALLLPERLRRLVLVSTTGRVDRHLAEVFLLWARMADLGLPPSVRHQSALLWCLGSSALADDERVTAYLRAKGVSDHPAGYAAQARACAAHDALDRLHQIRVPTLVVAGTDDRLTPLTHAEALSKAIPPARLATIPGAGHLPYLETPELFDRHVLGFLTSEPLEESHPCPNASTAS